jgi:cyclophilin family peptidyl-prolyl cis-trans isomerase
MALTYSRRSTTTPQKQRWRLILLAAVTAAAALLLPPVACDSSGSGSGGRAGGDGSGKGDATPPPLLSRARAVFQTNYGDIEFAFLPDVAPVTAAHIFKLVTLGAYTTNHIFRVDKGFVAQVADVAGGRTAPSNHLQRDQAAKTVPLEVRADVKHTAGAVSMGRYDDPNSGTSSFSFLLGDAPHLDMQYTIFGRVTRGMDTLHKLEALETRREGIFVMPKERVTIVSSYWYVDGSPFKLRGSTSSGSSSGGSTSSSGSGNSSSNSSSGGSSKDSGGGATQQDELNRLRMQVAWQAEELHRVRAKCLPSRRR